ncbi:MAG TPA: DUF896 domain-containing protein [Syntrophomonadaceae bacterium]|nr:DUF896 domain-containing protein [Syntrophomonadaceae bacterium]
MDEKQIARINELAKLKKERRLTNAEVKEQQNLREKYLKNIRKNMETQLKQAGHTKRPDCQCGCQNIKNKTIL